MGLLSWLTKRIAAEESDDQHAEEIVERIVGLCPSLRLARNYASRLRPAAQHTLAYLDRLAEEVPPAREASAAAWATDPYIHAFFATPDEVCPVFNRSHQLNAFFNDHPVADQVFAVLGMAFDERHIFGVGQQGETTQTDLAQTTLNFSDHQVRVCGESEAALRREIVLRIVDQLVLEGLGKIEAETARQDELQRERALLKTRLTILERQGAGVRSLLGSDASSNYAEVAKLQAQIEENDQALAQLGLKTEALERHLDVMCGVLQAPDAHFYVRRSKYRLDRMNVVVEDGDTRPAHEIEFRLAHLPASPNTMRVFSTVRFRRADFSPPLSDLAQAHRLI
ncbi:hypothetical protein OKW33_003624 [Paraburkholderia atlantica]|uniref:Uncharacterized protein n=1 Tax=Paraburkholderia atlantica TaxID=2654982 RepID=A0A6I1PYJ3_PARAM|nr:hypothetical protein [Paraburkholderia atlantica]MBB5425891.1 hypothetical protein [Paraburkholderia atlantica]MPW06791.1 hypothetical protein [Paraburkholderia atlantica]